MADRFETPFGRGARIKQEMAKADLRADLQKLLCVLFLVAVGMGLGIGINAAFSQINHVLVKQERNHGF